jgi:glycosyltransferase involved in cell wall biosynthesis
MKILAAGHSFIIDANRLQWKDLASLGHIVDLITPAYYQSSLQAHIDYKPNPQIDYAFNKVFALPVHFPSNNSFFFFSPLKLFSIFRLEKYDAMILMQETWSLSLFFFVLLKTFTKNRRTPLYLGITQNLKKKRLYPLRFLERFNCYFCRGILGCCDETREVLEWKGIKTPWDYFPFSYSDELIAKPSPIIRDKIVIGYLGRLEEEKGLIALKQAFLELHDEMGGEIEMLIAGAGSLDVLFHHHPQIHFLGRINHTAVKDFYEKINVFVLPSETRSFWKEQFGRVLIETVAAKRLVIGSNSGAIPEVLSKMGIHSIFQEGNVKDLKRAIRIEMSELNSQELEKTLEKRARLCAKNFESKEVAQYLENILYRDKENLI